MNKFFLFLFLGLVVAGFVSGVEIDDEILEKFDEGAETVRVLMKVKANDGSSSYSKVSRFGARAAAVSKGRVNKEVGDYVSSYISKDEFEMLVASDAVESISIERTYHTLLQDSVGIMNVSSAWNLQSSGLNLTGAGQSVCIIDTGVNYSHPDFGGCSSADFTSGTCVKVIGGWDFCGNDGDCAIEDGDVMDVEGHGTHVAGIVAASGGIDGVGKGANIVMMKAANASGVFFTINIVGAINRCVANASVYNISVISMSLGGGQYSGYCDSNGVDNIVMASSINDAVAAGISVVVATGNTNGDYPVATAGISSPACIENVTRVSASTKADDYAGYAFRHSFFKDILIATGGYGSGNNRINSTVIGGGYGPKVGTSMATPMVAGAIAIVNQYLALSGQSMTPSEISSLFNETGVVLDDSAESGYNFSRIDVDDAILSLDVDDPNVTLVSPVDNHVNLSVNQSFVCNATDWQLANVTLSVWNSTGLYYNGTNNLTGVSNESSFDLVDMPEDAYEWNCFVVDNLGNVGNASANFSLTIGGIEMVLDSPSNNSYSNVGNTNFTCNSSSDSNYELSNVTFYLWNSSGLVYNLTSDVSGFSNSTIFNYTFVNETNYSWNCLGVNNGSNESWGDSNFSFVYDVTVPVISSLASSVSSSGATLSWTTDEVANSSISLGGGSWSNSSGYELVHSIAVSGLSASAPYSYNVTSCDRAGNCGSSDGSFTTRAAAVVRRSGGPSGGPSAVAVVPTEPVVHDVSTSEVSGGYTKSLKKGDKVNFSIFDFEGGRHLLTVDEVGVDYVNLTIESDPIKLVLGVGQSVRLNLTSANYYDLFIKLNNITNGSAELTIQLINEPIEAVVVVEKEVIVEKEVEGKDYFWVVIVLVVILVAIVFVVVRANKGKKLKGKKTKKKNGKGKKVEA